MKSKVKRKKVYFITVVIVFAICMVGVIFGSRLVFQRTCERRTTPWSDLGTADDDEYRILIDAYKIKNQLNETVMIQALVEVQKMLIKLPEALSASNSSRRGKKGLSLHNTLCDIGQELNANLTEINSNIPTEYSDAIRQLQNKDGFN